MSYRSRGTRTRALAGVVAALLALGLLPLFSGVANAQARDTADACPADAPDAFTDDEGNTHEPNINCIAFWDITQGTTATTYSPRQGTRRDQMATFIANLIDTAAEGGGTALPASPPDAFTDDNASVHHNNINRLAAADVVNGTTATTYSPAALVTRAQMATFIAQAIDYVNDGNVDGDQPPATTNDAFTDDNNSVHEDNINRIAEQDIVVGTGGGNFTPGGIVFRDQMASFLAQAADYLAELGFWPPVPGGAIQATATQAPELLQAVIESHSGTTLIVRYRFDEALSASPNAALFKVYPFNNTTAFETGDVAALLSGDNTVVRVQFDGISSALLGTLTVATVMPGAVTDTTGVPNPEGDSGLQTASTQAGAATNAPDLLTVGGFTAAPGVNPTSTRVSFEFDENAWNVASTGYHLVHTNGTTDTVCTFVSGNGTTTHVVDCPNLAGNVAFSATNVARGYVDPGTVSDAATGGNQNVLQAADVAGTSDTPDLTSVAIDDPQNRVTYNFDEVVRLGDGSDSSTATAVLASFTAYDSSGNTTNPTQVVVGTNQTSVIAQFATITASHVGASVEEGAVEERFSPNRDNQEDEERREAGQATTVAAGRTNAPDLTGVSRPVVATTNLQGQPATYAVTYTFDENVAACSGPAQDFHIYLADGTQISGDAIANCGATGTTPPGANQVRVTFNAPATTASPNPANAVSGGVLYDVVSDADGPNPEGYEVMPAAS